MGRAARERKAALRDLHAAHYERDELVHPWLRWVPRRARIIVFPSIVFALAPMFVVIGLYSGVTAWIAEVRNAIRLAR